MTGLRARLFAAIGLIALVSVALAFAIGAVLTRRAVEKNTLRDLGYQADVLAQRERDALLPFSKTLELQPFLNRQRARIIQAPLDGSSPYLPREHALRVRAGERVDGTIDVDGERHFFAARKVQQKAFVLLRPTRTIAQSWRPHLQGLAIGAVAAALLAGAAAFFLARAVARPVRRVAAASRSLAHDEAPPPVPVEGARELRVLASSFNDMAVELARARAAERQFLLSVSHELKTPLTSIRGYAEAVADDAIDVGEAVETIEREAARLQRLVHDLLDLARMNKAEFSVRREQIDLAQVAREAVSRYEAQARDFDVALEAEGDAAPAIGDADRVLQVVSNLVENALRVTPRGGSVRVTARPGALEVADTGPGLEQDELPRAFDRFFLWERYGGKRKVGTGLGLAIVKQLAEGMGGSVDVSSSPAGTRFVVRLPASTRALARV